MYNYYAVISSYFWFRNDKTPYPLGNGQPPDDVCTELSVKQMFIQNN